MGKLMNKYKVALTRVYIVTINAENEEMAKRLSEFYLGNLPDLSNEKDRRTMKFSIDELEMAYNDAPEIIEEIYSG